MLVQRVRTATGLRIVADPRLGDQPLWVKAVPGSVLRSGEALKALCEGAASSIRALTVDGKTVFVLTDDVDGWERAGHVFPAGRRRQKSENKRN
jgi:hypothetical protein